MIYQNQEEEFVSRKKFAIGLFIALLVGSLIGYMLFISINNSIFRIQKQILDRNIEIEINSKLEKYRINLINEIKKLKTLYPNCEYDLILEMSRKINR